MTEYRQENRAFYDKHGICVCCGKAKRAEGFVQCPKCLERQALYQAKKRASATPEMKAEENARRRELYKRRKDTGVCPYCGKPATHGLYCYEHSVKVKRHNQQTVAHEKQKRHDRGLIYDYRKANRLCRRCAAPIEEDNNTQFCNTCRAEVSEWARKADHTHWRAFNDAFYAESMAKYAQNTREVSV